MMEKTLNSREEQFVRHLLNWDTGPRQVSSLMYTFLLIVGIITIIFVLVATLRNLNDRTALFLLVPGFLIGVLLIALYITGHAREIDRHRFAQIIRKLQGQ